jgi:hypothetical protein
VSRTGQQRFAILGVMVAVFTPAAVRAAREFGWIPSKTGAIAFAVAIGLFCIVGAIIAYRTTQAQVRRDLDEVQNAGKIR